MGGALRFWFVGAALLLAACNAVISEVPVFTEADRSGPLPRDGIWVAEDPECVFDVSTPEASWPRCAMWLVIRGGGSDVEILDGKGQSETVSATFVAGDPMLVQGKWIDRVKEPPRPFYAFYAIDAGEPDASGRFSRAQAWLVQCGIQDHPNSDLTPFPGITDECRPTSKEAIRSAAAASSHEEMASWRWVRWEEIPGTDAEVSLADGSKPQRRSYPRPAQ